jgi:gliding motility-associated-like protein
MRQRILVLLTFISFLGCNAFSQQDVWLQSSFSPSSGCGLTNSEPVNVLINNNSAFVMGSGTIDVYYTIDGGSLSSQPLTTNLFPGASWNFSFPVNADVSGCGPHTIKAWVTRAGDPNHFNDTLVWTIQNDCPIVPGDIQSDMTVCETGNSGTLTLAGWSNGSIMYWEYSTDNGTNWVTTAVNSLSYNFSNLTQETIFHVVIDGASCSKDTSGIATVSLQSLPTPGTVSGSDSMCVSSVAGAFTVAGASGPPIQWEYSSNNGASWSTIPSTATTQNYSGLPVTTLYRVLTDGGACPDVYSDTAHIYVEQLTDPATMLGSDSLCANAANGTLTATGNIGAVLYWQNSTNGGATWNAVPLQTTTTSYTALPVTTWYRVFTDGGFCPSYYSDTAIVFIQPIPPQPTLLGSDSLCASNASGTINMSGPGTVLHWEYSANNGSTWNNIFNPTTTQNYTNIPSTREYRVQIEGGACPDFYSDTAVIFIQDVTDPGTISGSDSVCVDDAFGFLIIGGNIGQVMNWEFSDDYGASWNLIGNNTTIQNYSVTTTTWYRAYTDGGVCPSYYSDTAVIAVDDPLISGSIEGSDTVCGIAPAGTMFYNGGTGTIIRWEYSIDNGASWISVLNNTNAFNYPDISITTMYRVLQGGSICGNVYSDTGIIMIIEPTDPGVLLSDHLMCVSDSFTLTLSGTVADDFEWQTSTDAGGTWSSIAGADSASYMVTNIQSDTWFQVIVESGICGADTTNSVTIFALGSPIVNAGPDVTITEGDTTLLIALGGGTGVWFPGLTLSDSVIPTPLAFPLVTTTYVYTIVDANGCNNKDSITVFVNPATFIDIKNVITANHDGYNDSWIIEGVEYFPSTFVIVFNIYGKEVYSNDNYQNDWGGTYKDKQLPNGTYYYTVKPGGTDRIIKGNLTIMGDE